MHRVVSDYTRVDDTNSNIKVFVRARPLEIETEQSDFLVVDGEESRKVIIRDPDVSNRRYGEVSFQFDKVFWTKAKQEEVFDLTCRNQIDHVLNGFNCCCFAYGQTGSGKTYTMFGEGGDVRGVIPRSVEYLFQCLAKRTSSSEVAMVCSFLEIYNDQIRDLGKAYLAAMGVESNTSAAMHEKTSDLFEKLAGKRGNPYFAPAFHKSQNVQALTAERPGLKEVMEEYNTMNYEIREDNEGNVFVKDLSLVPVTTMEEVMSLIATGLKVRATHETKMNAFSSRSHTVFTITVLQRDKITGEAITGMMNLVDLAGSERLKKSESIGIRLKEALHINTSLTALGKVIMALDPSSENSHIPYRDSKLTRVLQNSLGGNSYTTVIATVHPSPRFYEECLSSLQFANRCRNVRNNPRVNYVEDTEDKDRKIRKLMEEVTTLRTKMTQLTGQDLHNPTRTVGGAGNLGFGGGGKVNVANIVGLLKKLGIAATMAPDGALLVNGQKFGAEDIGLHEGSAADSTGDFRGGKDSGGGGNVEKLQKIIKELKESNSNYSAKSKERKLQMEEQGRQLQKMSVELIKLQTGIRHKEFECKTLAEEKEKSLAELKAFLEGKYAADLQQMIQHNKELMNQHQADIDKIPTALTEYTKLFAKVEKERSEIEGPIRIEFETQLKEMEKSRLAELDNVKQQFNFWLEEKDKALSGFVDSFNSYKAKKQEQLRIAEREIVRLYEYYEELDIVMDNARRGKYYVKVRDAYFQDGRSRPQSAATAENEGEEATGAVRGVLVVPKAEMPENPFKAYGPSTLSLTRKIVQKHKERKERLQKMKADALEKSVKYAHESAKFVGGDLNLKTNVHEYLVTKAQENGTSEEIAFRPKSLQRPMTAEARVVKALPDSHGIATRHAGGEAEPHKKAAQDHDLKIHNKRPVTSSAGAAHSTLGLGSERQGNSRSNKSIHEQLSRGGASTAPGGLQSRSKSDIEGLGEEAMKSPSRHALEKVNKELVEEIERLRLSEQSSKQLSAELHSRETLMYIQKLEQEGERLKKLVKEINSQLHHAKVANKALIRKFGGQGYDSLTETFGDMVVS